MLSQECFDNDEDIHFYKRRVKVLEREKFQFESVVVEIGEKLQKAKKNNELNLSSCTILDILHYIKRFVEEVESTERVNQSTCAIEFRKESATVDVLINKNQTDKTESEVTSGQQSADKAVSRVKNETTTADLQTQDTVQVAADTSGNGLKENNDMETDEILTTSKLLTKSRTDSGMIKTENTTANQEGVSNFTEKMSECDEDKMMESGEELSESSESTIDDEICDPKKKFKDNEGWIHCNCGYKTKYNSNFSRHKRKPSKSVQTEQILCDVCGRFFTSMWGLTQHFDRKHKTIYEKLCSKCGQIFSSEWLLKGHFNTKHKKKKKS